MSPCLFNSYAEYIMQNAGLDEAQGGIKTAWRNNNNLRYADDTTLTAESEEPLDEGERGEWKSWLETQHSKNDSGSFQKTIRKLNIQKTPGDRGQGSLVCCSPWGEKESNTTEQLNNNLYPEIAEFSY